MKLEKNLVMRKTSKTKLRADSEEKLLVSFFFSLTAENTLRMNEHLRLKHMFNML